MKEIIRQKIEAALRVLIDEGIFSLSEIPDIEVVRPKDEQFGEYTTNVALVLGKQLGMNPGEVAEKLVEKLSGHCERSEAIQEFYEIAASKTPRNDGTVFEKIEVAGPGHINFYLSQETFSGVLGEVIKRGGHYGDLRIGEGKKVNNEFISANPTGPLHLGNARGGFYGDTISRVLRKAGYEVANEYYVNDAGEQIEKLGHSVLKDEAAVYSGNYIDELNAKIENRKSKIDPREAGEWAAKVMLEEMIKPTVSERMNIPMDLFVSEKRDIVEAGLVDRAIGILRERGLVFESEGALWLRTTDFGDDKDRVLVKSDGERTYFASDCGYLLHKMDRGFVSLIEIWGADHHGYTGRFSAAAKALGFDGEIKFFLMQLVRLMKDGQEVRMSKRAGNVVTIDELLGKIPVDVARFFFLLYSPDTHMNFDLGLAEEHSAKNPVYYVQYAHARLSSVLRKAEEKGIYQFPESHCERSETIQGRHEIAASKTPRNDNERNTADFSLLSHPKERELLRELLFFPELIEEIAETYAVHKLPQYAIRIADKLHSFYDECRVIDDEQPEATKARLGLVSGVKGVLGETLRLMGVSAPERMEQGSDKEQVARNKEEETKTNI